MAATGLLGAAALPSMTQVPGVPNATLTGGTPAAPNATPANVASVTAPAPAAARTITQDETVSGQLNSLLNADNTYLQSARNRGMEQANQRGLINSSLAAGTAERAAIDAAMPIAAQDANTNATAGQSAQNANQDLSLTGYKSILDAAQQSENFGYRTAENDQNIAANIKLQDDRLKSTADLQTQAEASQLTRQTQTETSALQQQTQQQQATLALQTTLKQMDIDFDVTKMDASARDTFTGAVSPIIQQVEAEIAQIQRLPNEQMDARAKEGAIRDLRAGMVADIQTVATLYNYSLDWPVASSRDTTRAEPRTGSTAVAQPNPVINNPRVDQGTGVTPATSVVGDRNGRGGN